MAWTAATWLLIVGAVIGYNWETKSRGGKIQVQVVLEQDQRHCGREAFGLTDTELAADIRY